MLKSSLWIFSDAQILLNRATKITRGSTDAIGANKRLGKRNKGVLIKNCAPFTDWISEINSTQVDNARYPDIVMPMYSLVIVIIIQNHQEVYGNISEIYQVKQIILL